VTYEVGAERLQDAPAHPGHNRARDEGFRPDHRRRQHAVSGQELAAGDCERDQRGGGVDHKGSGRRVGRHGAQEGRHDEAQAKKSYEFRAAPHALQKVRTCHPWEVPDLLHCVDAVLGKAERAVGQQDDRDDQPYQAAAVQHVDVVAQLASKERELTERRAQDLIAQVRMAAQDEPEDGHQQQQQGKQSQKSRERENARKVARSVVAVLLDDREGDSGYGAALLKAVGSTDRRFDPVHEQLPGKLFILRLLPAASGS